MPLEKNYNPSETEATLYDRWEKTGAFACNVNSDATPYTIMIPPPNVTGSLHMGHALTFTLQDILIRYHRMTGRDTLWQPGTDHAGIATQMVVERQLAEQGIDRRDMGRDAFIEKVWEWKAQSGGRITQQLRRLGASCDWSRERFTMDEGLNRAVAHEFVTLYREGLIYKDNRLVNWDPKMQTAVSDLEVEQKETKGNLWHFKYPIENSDEFIIVATTRPETMLGDTAVAVHPENEKLKHLIGKNVVLPLVGRTIPIVGDEYADPEKGTGAVKITPAHDFNDFEVGKRHNLPMINIFNQYAKLNDEVPEKYRGLDRFEARKRIVDDMEAQGLLDKIEPHVHVVPHGDRSGVPIEPWLSEQWYCDAKKLAEPAIKAVEEGRTKFVPEQWTNTYYAWMRNIQPWCISRQLWWGHQIPAWYGEDGHVFVEETEEAAHAAAEKHYGKKVTLTRDPDTFDTWFSSGLWPFSTLGWPDKTPELDRYYPTDVLVTGFDIIFFWVARMMMLGIHFMGDVPFKTVYIHALVRDAKGQKMSKTKGNVIDPLDVIDEFGCDALRFTLANMSTPGRDIRLATGRIEGNRNFATKLWNAARFCEMNGCAWDDAFDPASVKQTVNKWIVGEVKGAIEKIAETLDAYRFDLSSSAAYDFIWNTFCDWYLEFTKPILMGDDEAAKAEVRATTAWALGQMLHALHPFMPYITEELWSVFAPNKGMLLQAAWPDVSALRVDEAARQEMGWVMQAVGTIRATRSIMNIAPNVKIPLVHTKTTDQAKAWFTRHEALIVRMAQLDTITADVAPIAPMTLPDIPETMAFLEMEKVAIDRVQERERLKKEAGKVEAEIKKIDAKLGNASFVDRAPPEVVDEQRERRAEAEVLLAKLEAAQKSLAA
ncbi:MAG: valine--tRNA ligase [Alphaproteobacteria bacterium]|nr:valine--tRNA ligase [Alphaproteobacteria bacterium]